MSRRHERKGLFLNTKYSDGYRTQEATHGWVSLAKDHRMEMCSYTVRFKELAQKRDASYIQVFSSGSFGNNSPGYYSTVRYTDSNRDQRYDRHLRVRGRNQETSKLQRSLPTSQLTQSRNQAQGRFSRKECPNT